MMKSKKPQKLNTALLVGTLLTAILSGLVVDYFYGGLAYRHTDSRVFMPTVLGLLFAGFLVGIVAVVFLISKITLTYRADVISGRSSKYRIFLYLLAGAVTIGLLVFGTEYLYENSFRFGSKPIAAADTYVFLIDDSSSMEDSDPNRQRYEAIEGILADKPDSTRFAVYSFADTTRLLVPMQTTGDSFPQYPISDEIMTEMKAGIEKVVEDCENGVWAPGNGVMLVMITDGAPSDFDLFHEISPVLDRCVKQNMTLGIVGVIGADNSLMRQMASYTGGTFTDISDPQLMGKAVLSVTGNTGRTRDLMSLRSRVNMDWVYALIRVTGIAMAGVIIALAAALAYGNNTAFHFIIGANFIKAIAAGMLLEFASQAMMHNQAVRLLTLILLGTIIARNGSTEISARDSRFDADFDAMLPASSPSYME